jgi:hypothetical protein
MPRDVGPLFIPHTQAAKLIEPGKRALHDPPPPAQSPAMLAAAHGKPRHDMSRSQLAAEAWPRRSRDPPAHSPAAAGVARLLRAAGESHPRAPGPLASRSGSRRSDEPHAAHPAPRRSGDAYCRAWLYPWDWARSGRPVHSADGTTVHDRPRPINLVIASQSSSAKWIRSHTLARCQSRRRRQHVIPDPHPSSWGSICQGMPLRRTKTMPVRHAQSETRGRPPCSRGVESARMARQDPITDLKAARGPITRSRYLTQEIRFEKFCYTL